MFSKTIITISLFLKLMSYETHYTNECQNDWLNYKNKKCIKVLNQRRVNYTEAIEECQSLNAELMIIESEEENLFLTANLYNIDLTSFPVVRGLYIGLKRKELNDSYHPEEFEWGDGSNHTYQNWAPGEPTPWLEPCVEIYYVDPSAGMWNDLPCDVPKYALCQKVIDQSSAQNDHNFRYESCETSGYVKYRNNCYKTYDESSALDWVSAERKCRSDHKNSGLVYIDDSYEHSFLRLLAKTKIQSIEMWIGLIARTNIQNIRYQWLNDMPLYYTAWDSSQPKFLNQTDSQCVAQDIKRGLWRSNPYCSDKRPFVCKISDHRVSEDQTYASYVCPKFSNATTGNTSEEWINLNRNLKHCLWFSGKLRMNWKNAAKYCHERNGTLISIHSKHESKLLQPLVQRSSYSLWIGLYQTPGGFYHWEDGSQLDYKNWAPGEPNDENQEFCVELLAKDMTWNDLECSAPHFSFICQINKITTNETIIDYKLLDTNFETEAQIDYQREEEEFIVPGFKRWSLTPILLLFFVILVTVSLVVFLDLREIIFKKFNQRFNNLSNNGSNYSSSVNNNQSIPSIDRDLFQI